MVGLYFHAPTGHNQEEKRREAQVQICGPCDTGGNFRGPDLQTGFEHGAYAISPRGGQGS